MLLLFNSMLSPESSTEKVIIKCSVKLYVFKEKLVIRNWWGIFYFHSRGLLKPQSLLLISIPLRATFLWMITLYTWLLIPGFDPFMLTVLKKKETRRTICQHDGLQVKRSTFETWPDHSFDFLGKTFHSHCTNVHPQVYN